MKIRAKTSARAFFASRVSTVVMLVFFGGCGADEGGLPDPQKDSPAEFRTVVRDSGGVSIVAVSEAPVGTVEDSGDGGSKATIPNRSAPLVREAHFLEIGSTTGEDPYLFDAVVGALRLSDGTIVVANAGTMDLRFFDEFGGYLRTVGGQGAGPGEYEGLSGVWKIRGDTLLSYDRRLGRLTISDPTGKYLASRSLGGPGGGFTPIGALRDGTVAGVRNLQLASDPHGVERQRIQVLLSIPGESEFMPLERTFWSSEIGERRVPLEGSTARIAISRPLPFSRGVFSAVGRSHVYIGESDRFEILVYDAHGSLIRVMRWADFTPVVVTDAMFEREIQESPASVKADLRRFPRVPTLPAFMGLVVAETGDLWVQEFVPSFESNVSSEWYVFDSEGLFEARVSVPAGLRVLQIGADFLLGVHTDALGVERVRLFYID